MDYELWLSSPADTVENVLARLFPGMLSFAIISPGRRPRVVENQAHSPAAPLLFFLRRPAPYQEFGRPLFAFWMFGGSPLAATELPFSLPTHFFPSGMYRNSCTASSWIRLYINNSYSQYFSARDFHFLVIIGILRCLVVCGRN